MVEIWCVCWDVPCKTKHVGVWNADIFGNFYQDGVDLIFWRMAIRTFWSAKNLKEIATRNIHILLRLWGDNSIQSCSCVYCEITYNSHNLLKQYFIYTNVRRSHCKQIETQLKSLSVRLNFRGVHTEQAEAHQGLTALNSFPSNNYWKCHKSCNFWHETTSSTHIHSLCFSKLKHAFN